MIGEVSLPSIGLGCMNLSHAYGVPPGPEVGERVLLAALDFGITHFDTAALYGFGRNEDLVGRVLAPFRDHIYLASKCGMTGHPCHTGYDQRGPFERGPRRLGNLTLAKHDRCAGCLDQSVDGQRPALQRRNPNGNRHGRNYLMSNGRLVPG